MNKALFLDRDGVINTDNPNYVWEIAQFHFTPFIFEVTQWAVQQGYLIIVITNQGGIGKGLYDHAAVQQLHHWMQLEFEKQGVHISRILYSPHHPSWTESLTRKPESLLFERACALHNIDPQQSWMIGDRCRDLIPAQKLGIRTLHIGKQESAPCASALHHLPDTLTAEKIIAVLA